MTGKQRAGLRKMANGIETILYIGKEGVTDQDSANACLKTIGSMDHALTSKKEAGAMLNAKCKSLGLRFDVVTRAYVPAGDGQ